ncbi:VanZ family protein [uncultured Microbulbifer sp.]|uniref:VanZ family protein n=1 Tax=uncultured Microbulbifer sp. TaxID=348147 RepID=UPI00260C4ED8|nr:VanZ family protein [uncultured Microbulbifer sp.]
MYKFLFTIALAFFSFILWIIYLANTASNSICFDLVKAIPYGDKFGHIFLFGLLAFLAIVASRFRTFKLNALKIYYGTLGVLIFALTEEASQAFLPSRTFDFLDLGADLIGIALASLAAHQLERRNPDINR